MPSIHRCVFGCVTQGVTIHNFPNPLKFPERFRQWVNLVGAPLFGISDTEIYKKKKVCDIHFTDNDRNRNKRLNALAVPSLHLPQTSHTNSEQMDTDQDNIIPSTSMSMRHSEISHVGLEQMDHQDNIIPPASVSMHPSETLNVAIQQMDIDQVPSTSQILPPSEISHVGLEQMDHQDNIIPPASVSMHPSETLNVAIQQMDIDQVPSTSQILPPSEISHVGLEQMDHQDNIIPPASVSMHPSETLNVAIQQMDIDQVPSTSQILPPSGSKKSSGQKCVMYNQTQKDIRKLKQEIIRLRKRCTNFKSRLENAEKLTNSVALQKVTSKMALPAKLFTNMQFRESKKKPKGRRFHLSEKVLSLSLFKRSPKCYSFMAKCFALPAAKTLRNLLGKIKISPGINNLLFQKMKINVQKMSHDERLCTLIFDEMHINPQIHFDAQNDTLKGFDSFTNSKIADHVVTFMVRGIKKQFKQPVAFYFSQNMTRPELKSVIKSVVKAVHSTGLKILATVCDQSSVNVGAIDSLIEESKALYLRNGKAWRTNVLIIDQHSIIPLYDVPHLMKGIRNNLLTKNLKYVDPKDKKEKIIKWEYFIKLYKSDQTYGELKILQKFTEEHVIPEKINKMKVKLAAQLLSRSVAVAVNHLCDSGKLDSECRALEPFVLFMDKLFDSLNANTFNVINGKVYRAGVKKNSPHHKLWQDAIIFLKNMNFIDSKYRQGEIQLIERKVPSINNFIKTIEGMQVLWKVLNQKHGFDIMLTRNFNQDPVENFFGNIRSLGVRNVSPNCINFEGAYKALLLNNFCSSQSVKTNCEDDMATYFQTIDFLLKEFEDSSNVSDAETSQEIQHINESLLMNDYDTNKGLHQRSYVCGWVLKKCLKYVCKTCKTCRNQLIDKENIENILILEKEFENKNFLVYPSKDLNRYFSDVQNVTTTVLKDSVSPKNVRKNIKLLNDILNCHPFNCEIHKLRLKEYFDNNAINILIYSWCRIINRILSGKLTYDGDDPLKISAQMYYCKNKHNKVNKK